jgi:outer membrane protein OmpA-like peptidoglycan-associated protein
MFGDDLTLSIKLKLPDSTITSSTIFKTPLKQGYKIDLNVVFANNSYAIDPIFYSEIDKFSAFMNEEQKVKVLISGHTDKAGDDASNQLLSQRRAESVKSYLIKKGINAQRIKTKGFGETMPAYEYAPNSESNILNRRIEVEIIEN